MKPRLALAVVAVVVAVLFTGLAVHGIVQADGGAEIQDVLWSFVGPVFVLVGAGVAARRPADRYPWLLVVAGLVWTLNLVSATWLVELDIQPVRVLGEWLASWLFMAAGALFVVWLPLLFPTGRLPSARWRAFAWLAGGYSALSITAVALRPGLIPGSRVTNPLGVEALGFMGQLPGVAEALVVPVLLAGLVVAVGFVRRFRRSEGLERQQHKVLLFSIGMLASLVPLFLLLGILAPGAAERLNALIPLAVLTLPMSCAVAVLRYRLFDVDRVISRTVAYALVTGVLLGLYAGGVFALSPLVAGVGGGSQLAVAASTLAVAAAFGPVRRRVQAVVDRRFNRARYDAQRTVETFTVGLRDEVSMDRLTRDLLGAVHATLAPAGASLWLRRQP